MAYIKQTWNTGDTITAEKLNHIEDGISNSLSTYTKMFIDVEHYGSNPVVFMDENFTLPATSKDIVDNIDSEYNLNIQFIIRESYKEEGEVTGVQIGFCNVTRYGTIPDTSQNGRLVLYMLYGPNAGNLSEHTIEFYNDTNYEYYPD